MALFYSIYDKIIGLTYSIVRGAILRFTSEGSKIKRFVTLQEDSSSYHLPQASNKVTKPRIWIHASSLGEYQIARPIIQLLKKEERFEILVTFFSPSGYDVVAPLQGSNDNPDFVFPLPLDSKRNVIKFITSMEPSLAIFLVSEYWPNYLNTLKRVGIPTVLYSVFIKPKYNKGIGGIFREKMMRLFSVIVTHDNQSEKLLLDSGFTNILRLPDPLVDNAIAQREKPFEDKIIEQFIGGDQNVLIGGSLHLDKDIKLMAAISKAFPDTKIILVPHEISKRGIEKLLFEMPGKTAVYSEMADMDICRDTQCLIIDGFGILSRLYRYGKGAYVGGGFTPLLHSIVEPLVYGIPIAFGPKIHRKPMAELLLNDGLGTVVKNESQICKWWDKVISYHDNTAVKNSVDTFCSANTGGAQKAVSLIEGIIKSKKLNDGKL